MTSAVQAAGTLILSFLVGLVGVAVWIRTTLPLVVVPEYMWVVPLIVAIIILIVAWPVKAMADGKKRTMSPLRAARIALLCQACTRAGLILAGLGIGGWLATTGSHAVFLEEQSVRILAAGLSSALLGGAGWLCEWWCSIDDDDDESTAQRQGA